jgi:hypothetical protein
MRQLPGCLPPAYVPAEGFSLELNGLGCAAAQLLGFREAASEAGDGEHPSSIDAENSIGDG